MEPTQGRTLRHDPMSFVESSGSLEAAKVRKQVFCCPKPGDEEIFGARIEEILAEQKPDGALSGHPDHALLATGRDRIGELMDLGASPERPEIKRALEYVLARDGRDPIEKHTGDNGMSLGVALSLHRTRAVDEEAVRDATRRRIECSDRWIHTSDLCPWTPSTQIRHLWAARHLDERADGLMAQALGNIVEAIDTNADTYNDVWGYVDAAGVVDHPLGRAIVDRLLPLIIDCQQEDGGWGEHSLVVFRALNRYGLLEKLRALPPQSAEEPS